MDAWLHAIYFGFMSESEKSLFCLNLYLIYDASKYDLGMFTQDSHTKLFFFFFFFFCLFDFVQVDMPSNYVLYVVFFSLVFIVIVNSTRITCN